jgi:squamous cell carcinoma antigen recognized by T-cells 3
MALAETVGKVNRVTVKPLMGTAIVEFAEESGVGRALLQLDGYEMDGATLKVGTIRDLHSYTSKHKQQTERQEKNKSQKNKGAAAPSIMSTLAPMNVRRPVLGSRGPKRGLGFVPKKTSSGATAGDVKATNSPAAPKSNADFKAMFLKSAEPGGAGKDVGTS